MCSQQLVTAASPICADEVMAFAKMRADPSTGLRAGLFFLQKQQTLVSLNQHLCVYTGELLKPPLFLLANRY